MLEKQNIAVFASGTGTNFQNIVNYFDKDKSILIKTLVTNNKNCGAVDMANAADVEVVVIDKEFNTQSGTLSAYLSKNGIDWIVLAGFLRKIPEDLLAMFPDRIINIHPSLLPKFGGKGMYGKHVHEAVLDAGEKESGITIHMVNADYDKGRVLFQTTCQVESNETPDSLAEKIHILEKEHFPRIIHKTITHGA